MIRMTWIKCSDSLPEKKETVLAVYVSEPNAMYNCLATGWFRDVLYTCEYLGEKNWEGDFWIESNGPKFSPTHWMPLPEFPNE